MSSLNACSYLNQLNPKFNATRCLKNNCFSMWMKNGNKFKLLNKGCWSNSDDCESNFVRSVLFCCCEGKFCNRKTNPEYCYRQVQDQLSWLKILKMFNRLGNFFFSFVPSIESNFITLSAILAIFILCTLVICYLITMLKKKKIEIKEFQFISNSNRPPKFNEKKFLWKSDDEIKKEKALTNGSNAKFIYKGKLKQRSKEISVAIKIYELENKCYFENEFCVYNLPNFNHENILKFLKAKKVQNELWLITKYAQMGSLLDFLKHHINYNTDELIKICLNISNGLAYLHGQNKNKFVVAHLDIKPGNIFLDENLNACIGDFELSRIFYKSKPFFNDHFSIQIMNSLTCFDELKQKRTIRYLSPEILNMTIDTCKTPTHQYIDLLLKSDIYACSLVYWEIFNSFFNINKLNGIDHINKQNYVMAYENFQNDELIDYVISGKRPEFVKEWRSNCSLSLLCQTIQECWAPESKARLSAVRLNERLKSIHNLTNKNMITKVYFKVFILFQFKDLLLSILK